MSNSIHHEPRLTGRKVCKKCGEEFPVICFQINVRNHDGLSGSCRGCNNKRNAKQPSKLKLLARRAFVNTARAHLGDLATVEDS